MKNVKVGVLFCLLAGMCVTGCMSPTGRPDYTATGALEGGAVGAVIGSAVRNPGAGALVGALVGGVIGHGLDETQEAQLKAQSPQTLQRVEQGQPLTMADVKALAKAGIGDDLVISQIRNSRTVYHLSTADILDLKNAGVSEKIIDFMINTPLQVQSAQVAGVAGNGPPPAVSEQIYVVPGPEYVWVGGMWFWLGDRWAWRPGYWHRPAYPHAYGHRWR